jgi:hypothetical protein
MRGRLSTRILAAVAVVVAAAGWAAPSVASAAPRLVAPRPGPRAALKADEFEGISCTTAKGCLAVGSRFSSKTDQLYALGETRGPGSSTWVVHDPPLVSGATTTGFGPIGNGETVSCASSPSAVCIGIGSYNNTSGQFNYAAEWNWASWKNVKVPNPSPSHDSGLDAVRCVSSSFCIAVGHWLDSSTEKFELESLVWNGKSWALEKMPPVPANATSPRLWGLSCVSKTWCMAVGDYDVGSSSQPLLSETWNGKSWTMHLPPSPKGISSSALVGVSCVSTTFCNAVGDSLNSKSALVSLGEVWNGKSWTVKATPSGKQKGLSELFDVSCQSAKVCLAVGNLAAQWNGTSWQGVTFPVPAGKSTVTNAVSLSCLSASDCTAAGGYSSVKQGTLTLAWNWNGKSFSLQHPQNP